MISVVRTIPLGTRRRSHRFLPSWTLVLALASAALGVGAAESRLTIEAVPNAQPRVKLIGTPGQRYEVQVSTNLEHWERQSEIPLTVSPQDFVDAEAAGFPYRFYRMRSIEPANPGGRRFLLGLASSGPVASTTFANQSLPGGELGLFVVDPEMPTSAIEVEPAGQHAGDTSNFIHQNSVLEATVDPATGLHTETRIRYTLYPRGNRIWKFDHEGDPAGEVLTTLSTTELCSPGYTLRRVAPDFADAQRSWVFFSIPGASGSCFPFPDDLKYLGVRLDMNAETEPREVPIPLVPLYAPEGNLSGFIVQDAEKVQRVDADFGQATTLFTVPNAPLILNGVTNYTTYTRGFLFGRSAPGKWLYLAVHNFLPEYLMGYDLAGDGSPVPIVRVPSSSSAALGGTLFGDWTDTDGTNVFLTLNESPTRAVIVRIGEEFSMERIATNSAAVHELALTDSQVIVRGDTSIWAFPKTGGQPRLLVTLSPNEEFVPKYRLRRGPRPLESTTVRIHRFVTGGENVWFETTVGRSSPARHDVQVVSAIEGQAELQRFEHHSLITWAAPAAVPWCVDTSAHAVYLVQRRIPTGVSDNRSDISDMPLTAHDARTRSVLFEVGRFPKVSVIIGGQSFPSSLFAQELMGEPLQFGQPGLIQVRGRPLTPSGESAGADLIYFRSDSPGLIPSTHFGIDFD